ncbi:MAG: hypothetical protein KA186_10575 [Flavobacteriales bacterium]|nr:hypothetical protein [Flavobacteriales bacterium]
MKTFARPLAPIATAIVLGFLATLPFKAWSQTSDMVLIKGQVIVSDQVTTAVDLTMDVGVYSCDKVLLFGRGKFEIHAKDGERYELRFEQVGSVSKTVMIDTKDVKKKVGDKKHVVEFDVVLAPMDTVQPLHYAQPVGKINFHKSNGRLLVEHNRQMVATDPALQQK